MLWPSTTTACSGRPCLCEHRARPCWSLGSRLAPSWTGWLLSGLIPSSRCRPCEHPEPKGHETCLARLPGPLTRCVSHPRMSWFGRRLRTAHVARMFGKLIIGSPGARFAAHCLTSGRYEAAYPVAQVRYIRLWEAMADADVAVLFRWLKICSLVRKRVESYN